MERSQLGTVVGRLLKAAYDFENDAISEHYGIWPDPAPELHRIAERCGWTLREIDHELTRRGVSDKWQYNVGMGAITWEDGILHA